MTLVEKSKSTVYYKLTNLNKLEGVALNSIQGVWNECHEYIGDDNFEELLFTEIENVFQGISQKITELKLHLEVAEKCQNVQQTKEKLKMLTVYKISLEGLRDNLKNIKQRDF